MILTPANIKSYILQTLQGCEYLHNCWILHRVSYSHNIQQDETLKCWYKLRLDAAMLTSHNCAILSSTCHENSTMYNSFTLLCFTQGYRIKRWQELVSNQTKCVPMLELLVPPHNYVIHMIILMVIIHIISLFCTVDSIKEFNGFLCLFKELSSLLFVRIWSPITCLLTEREYWSWETLVWLSSLVLHPESILTKWSHAGTGI